MSTVITTQPRNSNIIDSEKKAQENENIQADTELLASGKINEEIVHLHNDENSQLKEKEEKRKLQEQTRDYKQDHCCMCIIPDDDPFCLYYCVSWIRSSLMCMDNCYCGNCKCNCCDSQNAVVDGQNIHNNDDCCGCDCSECDCSGCDCSECDCSECDCSGCDCSGCDCSGCDCGDCVECCLCFGGLLECCKN